jgi:hypothetical protein
LEIHVTIHTQEGQASTKAERKPCPTPGCNYRWLTQRDLETHAKTHDKMVTRVNRPNRGGKSLLRQTLPMHIKWHCPVTKKAVLHECRMTVHECRMTVHECLICHATSTR